MKKFLLKRIIGGILSIIAVVAIVMILIYSLMDRQLIFATDNVYRNLGNNAKSIYKYQKWEEYGYIDYVLYATQPSMPTDAMSTCSLSRWQPPLVSVST